MLIRLWWKEWRSLLPIMVTLVLAATALQWFLLTSVGSGVRNGVLVPIALGWAVLYAIAAGSASFAGERENRTMGLLDALPVGRGMLWFAKATWAVGSSLGLALVLRWISSIGWSYESLPTAQMRQADPFFLVLIVEAAVWGLFWSALARTAITASILAILSTGIMSSLTGWLQRLDSTSLDFGGLDRDNMLWRGGGMLIALAVSCLVLNREHWPRRQNRVVTGNRDGLTPVATDSNRSDLRIWPTPAYWSIAWQTVREGRGTWLQCLGLLVLVAAFGEADSVIIVALTLISLTLVILGASVFGIENSTGTRAFLDNYAVRPRTVWAAKVTPWAVGLGIIMLIALLNVGTWGRSTNVPRLPVILLLGNMVGVALLGGMIFPRRITAALISIMVGLGLIIPQAALITAQVIPVWSLALSPLLLIAASWFWAGDWLANRGWRRWGRLAILLVVPYAVLVATFIGGRAWGIADIGSQVGSANFGDLPANDLGAEYRAVIAQIQASQYLTLESANALNDYEQQASRAAKYLEINQPALAQLRRLAAQPGIVAALDAPATIFVKPRTTIIGQAGRAAISLLGLDASNLWESGDLAGAWADIEAMMGMSRQYAAGARSVEGYKTATDWTTMAVQHATDWSTHPKMTVELIRAARAKLRELTEPPRMVDAYRFEALRIERSLDQPGERWADLLNPALDAGAARVYSTWVIAPTWERERARRLMRRVVAKVIANANLDHRPDQPLSVIADEAFWDRSSAPRTSTQDQPLNPALHPDITLITLLIAPLANNRNAYDGAIAQRRVLDTYLALRSWQLTHDGFAPDTLDELVPTELEQLPEDPFAERGVTFRYDWNGDPGRMGMQSEGMAGMMGGMAGPPGDGPNLPMPGEMTATRPAAPQRRFRGSYRLWYQEIRQSIDARGVGNFMTLPREYFLPANPNSTPQPPPQ